MERFEMDYRCEAPSGERWFTMVVTPLATEGGGAVITHVDITDRKRVEEQLAHQALHDPLTGLPNRALFGDHLALAMARRPAPRLWPRRPLRRPRPVQDRQRQPGPYGRRRGPAAVAVRLAQLVRAGDTVARFGGDEFAILCEDLEGKNEAFSVAERIVEGMRAPIPLETGEAILGASVGVVHVDDGHPDPDARADIALYRAKERGRGRFEVCHPQLHAEVLARLRMERELGRAVERGELRLSFQPLVRQDGSMMGAEALLRWAHPERGLIQPLDVIPLAEETGLIVPIGGWVLREACRQGVAWARRGHPHLRLGVNISAVQLSHGDLDVVVRAALAETGLDPTRLTLEITESTFIEHEAEARPALERLRAFGVRIAMDDFGTGYSSLSAIKSLPVDVLKLDRAFVSGLGRDPQDHAIVSAIVRLAVTLDLAVVAEGVEDERHVDELRALGCDDLQGYHFGRPEPAEVFAAKLAGAR